MKLFIILSLVFIYSFIFFIFFIVILREKKWRRNLTVGSRCCVFEGEERIYDCHVILKQGNVILAEDPFKNIYGRFIDEVYIQLL